MTADVRQLLVDSCRILAANGQEHFAFGHVSAREAPGADRFWFKGRGLGLGEITLDDLVLLDLDGNQLGGTRPVHDEYPIHAEIFRARPEVTCVVHTHPFESAALAATAWDFRMVGQDAVNFWNGVGRYLLWSDIPNNEQLRWLEEDNHVARRFRFPSGNSNGRSSTAAS